jgi:hypothetical protein
MTTAQLEPPVVEVDRASLALPGKPGVTVAIAAACGSKVDLPDDEWLAAFHRTTGSIDDERFHRPEQPVLDPAPSLDF